MVPKTLEKVSSNVTDKISMKVTETISSKLAKKVSPKVTEKISPKVTEQVSPKATEKINPEVEKMKVWIEKLFSLYDDIRKKSSFNKAVDRMVSSDLE